MNEKNVHDLFCAIAGRYDFLNSVLSFNLDKYWRRVSVGLAGLKQGDRVLDVGCGTGRLSVVLANRVGIEGKVVGLDFCREMLDVARVFIARTPFAAQIELVEGNAMELPFPDDMFDCVASAFVLRNFPDLRTGLREMLRVLRPGGTVMALELAKPGLPVFKQLYYLYFERIVPWLGGLGVGASGPYCWLPESLRRFPHQEQLKALFYDTGFQKADYYEITGGVAAVHIAVK